MDEKDTKNTTEGEAAVNDSVETNPVSSTEVVTENLDSAVDKPAEEVESEATPKENTKDNSKLTMRLLTGGAIVLLVLTMLFAFEKRGILNTSFFSGSPAAIAVVNDVEILRSDFDSGIKQRAQAATLQGVDTNDPDVKAQLETETIETLIGGELLRQAAVAQGFTVEPIAIEARFNEIRDGVGGAEVLQQRMSEIGITEATLRRDIANDYLIQQYIEANIDFGSVEVTEEEALAFYESRGGEAAGNPPFAEVREQVELYVQNEKALRLHIETLREAARVDIRL